MLARQLSLSTDDQYLTLVNKEHRLRADVEYFIQQCFFNKYGAQIRRFSDELFCAHHHQKMVGAFSVSRAAHSALYVEQYLDEDIENLCSTSAGQTVQRESIVEIGSVSLLSSRWFVPILRAALFDPRLNASWAIFTTTPAVLGLLNREKIYPQILSHADPENLTDRCNEWGNYYVHNPCVYLVSINHLRRYYSRSINDFRYIKSNKGGNSLG